MTFVLIRGTWIFVSLCQFVHSGQGMESSPHDSTIGLSKTRREITLADMLLCKVDISQGST